MCSLKHTERMLFTAHWTCALCSTLNVCHLQHTERVLFTAHWTCAPYSTLNAIVTSYDTRLQQGIRKHLLCLWF